MSSSTTKRDLITRRERATFVKPSFRGRADSRAAHIAHIEPRLYVATSFVGFICRADERDYRSYSGGAGIQGIVARANDLLLRDARGFKTRKYLELGRER